MRARAASTTTHAAAGLHIRNGIQYKVTDEAAEEMYVGAKAEMRKAAREEF